MLLKALREGATWDELEAAEKIRCEPLVDCKGKPVQFAASAGGIAALKLDGWPEDGGFCVGVTNADPLMVFPTGIELTCWGSWPG